MGRKKVNLQLIRNESVRKTTFRKRKAGLLKKVKELTTLCGVQGCALIFNPNGDTQQPHVWPSMAEASEVLERFRDLPVEKQGKHMINEDGTVLRKRPAFLRRSTEEVKRKRDRELEMEMELESLLRGVVEDGNEEKVFGAMRVEEMKELMEFLDGRISAIEGEIDNLKMEADDVSSDSDDDDEDYDEEQDSMSSSD